MLAIEKIQTEVVASNWQEAIEAAGKLLVNAGSCTSSYIDEMIAAVHDMGPYIVMMPHVALAHSRPSSSVKVSDMSLAVLKEAVPFNHEHNDPVKLVFAFCATDNDGHLAQLTKLSGYLSDPSVVNALMNATSAEEVVHLLEVK